MFRTLLPSCSAIHLPPGGSLLTHEVDFISKRFHSRLLGFHPSLTDFIAFAFCLRALLHRYAEPPSGGSLLTHEVDFISKRFHPRLLGFHPSLTDFIAFAFCLRALLHRYAEPPPRGSLKLHLAVTSFAKQHH